MMLVSVGLMLVALGSISCGPDDIYLEDGGYKGILIAIDQNVEYDPNIIPNLRSVFVKASEALYRATEYDIRNSGNPADGLTSGKHFAEIKVLVPKNWPRVSDCDTSISELIGNADFKVKVDTAQWGSLLLSTQLISAECREPGQYTTIPETFIKDLSMAREYYGQDLGKAILHEWAQLRWGIHEESNFKQGGETCTVLQDWNLYRYRQPVKCSLAVKGITSIDPEDEKKCAFTPEPESFSSAQASIMFFRLPFYSKMYTFCDSRYEMADGEWNMPVDDVMHDDNIEHIHNRVCNRQSAWQVLREHPDFNIANAGPLDLEFDFDAALDFQCLQQPAAIRMVLVLDVSSSMSGERLTQMQGDVALFLQSIKFDETDIGMLEFYSSADELVEIIPLNSNDNLQQLLDAIPKRVISGTCIGCGLQLALAMLEKGGKQAAGGLIVVFTDGGESSSYFPKIAEMRDEVIKKEAIVHGLIMDGVADDHDLITLSIETGGRICIFEDSGSGGIDYYQCMMTIVQTLGDFAPLEVKTDDVSVPSGGTYPGTSNVDSSFKDSLRFTLSWTSTFKVAKHVDRNGLYKLHPEEHDRLIEQLYLDSTILNTGCDQFELLLTAPNGETITTGDPRYNKQVDFKLITVDAAGYPFGEWKYEVQNPHNSACDARLRIEAFPDVSSPDDEKLPIMMTSWADKTNVNVDRDANPLKNLVTLYVSLKQGLSPVIDAEVYALVESGTYSQTVYFKDDGAGADLAKEDGIYSTYFYEFNGDGVYSVRAFADGVTGQTMILRETRRLEDDREAESFKVIRTQTRLNSDDFERAAIGGVFEVAVNGVTDMNTIIPPSKIGDLRKASATKDSLELTWTAVGASMRDGTATSYNLHICENSTQAFDTCSYVTDDMLMQNTTLLQPKPSGSMESIVIDLSFLEVPEDDTSHFIVIKAVDNFGNMGASSNIAILGGPVTPDDSSSNLGAILGSIFLVLVVAALVGGAVFGITRRMKSRDVTTNSMGMNNPAY